MKIVVLVILVFSSLNRKIIFEQAQKSKIHNIDYIKDTLRTGVLGYMEPENEETYVTVNLNQKSIEVINENEVNNYYLSDIVNVELSQSQKSDEECIKIEEKDQKQYTLCFNDSVMLKDWL